MAIRASKKTERSTSNAVNKNNHRHLNLSQEHSKKGHTWEILNNMYHSPVTRNKHTQNQTQHIYTLARGRSWLSKTPTQLWLSVIIKRKTNTIVDCWKYLLRRREFYHFALCGDRRSRLWVTGGQDQKNSPEWKSLLLSSSSSSKERKKKIQKRQKYKRDKNTKWRSKDLPRMKILFLGS